MGCVAVTVMFLMLVIAFLLFFNTPCKANGVEGVTVPNPLDGESGSSHLKETLSGNVDAMEFPYQVFPNELLSDGELSEFRGDDNSLGYGAFWKFVIYPDDDTGYHSNPTRFRRFPKTCNDTIQKLKNAIITCWAWPNFLTCEINCSHGYAMKEKGNIQRSTVRKCRESNPKWYPVHYFPSCQPYIHCDVILNMPGRLKCHSKPPAPRYCDIECKAYDDHNEVPERRYECLDEKYGQTLPPCASLNKSGRLLPPPKI